MITIGDLRILILKEIKSRINFKHIITSPQAFQMEIISLKAGLNN